MEEKTTDKNIRKNPFFEPYTTPHETVPFDKIKIEDYEEAFMEGIYSCFLSSRCVEYVMKGL